MSVAVIVPWRASCDFRRKALSWVAGRHIAAFVGAGVDFEIILGESPPGPFNRSAAILTAAAKTDADVLVVTDADVYADPTEAITMAADFGWAIPHRLIHRLSRDSTDKVLAGADWRGLPLSTDNNQDRRPYAGNETGTLFVIRRQVLLEVPPDVRFVGWGHEDKAYGFALRTLAGPPWRGDADLVHLWHPPQPRLTRRIGNRESQALERRYREARDDRERMRALVEESKALR